MVKLLLTAAVSAVMAVGNLCGHLNGIPAETKTIAASTAAYVKKAPLQIPEDAFSYNTESLVIPNAKRGGVYFFDKLVYKNSLYFYSFANGTFTQAYNFGSELETIDSYQANGKLYLLRCSDAVVDYTNKRVYTEVSVDIFDLDSGKFLKSVKLMEAEDENASFSSGGVSYTSYIASDFSIGVDNSGLIYIGNGDKTIYLYNDSGKKLSETTAADRVFKFIGFDSKSGDFYYECYYNWIYWGYEHDMSAVAQGNVTNNKFTDKKDIIELIRQLYFYERENGAEVLNGRYLCIDSILYSTMSVYDLTKGSWDTPLLSTARNNDDENGNFIDYASLGSRATLNSSGTSMIMVKNDNCRIEEVSLSSGKSISHYDTAYPVFYLGSCGENVVAVEKSDDKYYLEIINWKPASKLTLTPASPTVKVGGTVQLNASANSDIYQSVTWSSSNNKVASVTDEGKVLGWKKGTAVITAKTAGGLTAKVTVTVTADSTLVTPSKNSVSANGTAADNASCNDYNVWSSVVNSYIFQNSDGSLTRLEYNGSKIIIETFDLNGKRLSSKSITPELSLFGGFYSGSSYNYIVFGQNNPNQSDSREVMRVVKYSKSWQKISSVSVKGANTYIPFDAGSLRMTETAGKLYIHTCHEMYDDGDNVHHQANMTYVIDEAKMQVTDSYYDVMNIAQAGYVSHSFNQFIQTDGKYIFRVDHGDAYPRAISIVRSDVNGSISDVDYTLPVDLSNVTGYNPTGASVGGFELSENSCIIAGNAVDYTKANADCYGNRNIFISITSKDLTDSKVIWLTKYTDPQNVEVLTPQLVKLSDNGFLVMWEEYYYNSSKKYVRMVTVDAEGNITSDTVHADMKLSDCQPIVCKDRIVRWYAADGAAPVIYSVNPYDLKNTPANEFITLSKPVLKSAENVNGGVKITWNKVSGASKYRVYYKVGSGSWTKIGDTTSTSFTWKNAVSGTNYKFTVRCLSSDGKYFTSSYNTTGLSVKYLAAPKLTSVKNSSGGVKISWNKVSGAEKYRVFYKTGSGSWKKIADTVSNSYTWSGASSGTVYTFTVRCVSSDSKKFTSGYDGTGMTIKRLAQPNISRIEANNSGVKITWNKVAGASSYRVYYKTSSGWKLLRDTSSTTCTINATMSKSYTYTVKALSGSYTSSYNSSGTSFKRLPTPSKPTASKVTGGYKFTWKKVTGATKYRVYYKVGSGSWTKLADTTSTSYTWKNMKKGQTYQITVRCLSADGKTFTSGYDTTGTKVKA